VTRKLQAGFVFILLFLSIYCTKENSSPLPSQTSKALTSLSADESVADEGISANILGSWIIHYSWGCTGSYNTTSFNVFSNGTFSDGFGFTGQWVKSSQLFMFHFDGQNTCYSGRILNKQVNGISATFNVPNSKGCFFMTRPATNTHIKEERIKGQSMLGGKQ
jgi:hypothetical protein